MFKVSPNGKLPSTLSRPNAELPCTRSLSLLSLARFLSRLTLSVLAAPSLSHRDLARPTEFAQAEAKPHGWAQL